MGDKAGRVLELLVGLRNKNIASALAAKGFGPADLERGLTLLKALTDASMGLLPPLQINPVVLEHLGAWEDEWFPVAEKTLLLHHPAIHRRVFLDLSQTDSPGVVITVRTFVERIEGLTHHAQGYGHDGVEARELLRQRGLTDAVLGQARGLLAKVEPHGPPAEPPDQVHERARLAEDALWSWYLEWNSTARAATKQRGPWRLGLSTATAYRAASVSASRAQSS